MLLKILKSLISGATSRGRYSVSPPTQENIAKDWDNINNLLKLKGPSQLRQALITADKSLDNALKDIIPGETMGERLKNAKDRFDPIMYNKIWEAHKVRNMTVHESGYEPPHFVLTDAVENLRKALISLGVSV
jgi:hypothetical protein